MDNSDLYLLKEAYECGIIEADVSDTIFKMKKEKVLSVHSSAITAPQNASARWQTYIKDEDGKRIKVSATSEKVLFEKLYKHYFVDMSYTLKSLFPKWIEKRSEEGLSPLTVRRNFNHWNKYYIEHPIVNKPLSKLNSEDIEKFFHESIKTYELTAKELNNMKFVMVDMLKMAKKRDIIVFNPMDDAEIKLNGCKPPKKQNDTSRVYLADEKEKLFAMLNDELQRKPDCTNPYAVFLLFKFGLRIGEIVAIKWADIDFDNNELHVHRMQTRGGEDYNHLHCCVVNYTKKKSIHGDRFLPLSDYEKNIFRTVAMINSRNGYGEDDFVFCNANGRTKYRAIDNLVRKCCKHAQIEVKSVHDIRRTVASELYKNLVTPVTIRDFLGHSDIKTTYGYILDIQEKTERNKMIVNSLNNLNGLKGTQVS